MSEHIADAYRFCPRCGVPGTRDANALRCTSCKYSFYFSPVAAVAGIVSDANGKILLLRRARDPEKGRLGLPGGFVDAGETLEEALLREIKEEASLDASIQHYLLSLPNEYVYKGVAIPVTDVFFECTVDSFEPLSIQLEEIAGCLFLTQQEPPQEVLGQMAFESNRKALEHFLKK